MRRVVLIAHELAPRTGGVAAGARALARGLAAKGIAVRVYAAKQFGPEAGDLPEGAVRRLYTPGIDLWGDLLITLDALREDVPDAVHLCDAGLEPWVPALAAASAAAVTVQARGDALVDGARFSPGPADAALAARVGIVEGDEVVLAVSRLAPGKGHATVLRALAEMLHRRPRALFVYTGENPLLSSELATLASDLGVRGHVRAAGVLPDDEIPALYRLARVFVRLSDDETSGGEGSGLASIEAAACGLPVVVTRARGLPETIEDGVTGLLVPPGDAHAAARAISAILSDTERARSLGERGRARALDRFSSDAQLGRLVDRWNVVLSSHTGPRPFVGHTAALAGEATPGTSARTVAARAAIRATKNGEDLLRVAREDAITREAAAAERRDRFARIVAEGGAVRLRAMRGEAGLLVDALADCAALGCSPLVETTLRCFTSPDFQASALPQIRRVAIEHSLPAVDASALVASLAALPRTAFAKVERVHLSLSAAAEGSPGRTSGAFREAQTLRRLFDRWGVAVTPPPELVSRIEADFGPRARDVDDYEETLCADRAAADWIPATLEQALRDQARLSPGERPLVVDFGCGVAVALLGLVATAARAGIEIDAVGLDRGHRGLLHGDPFPTDEAALRCIVEQHGARIGALGRASLPSVRRCDLEDDPWPLEHGTVALAVSRTAVMYLADKLRFLERVYRSLRAGGVALIHLDHVRAGTRQLQRIRLPAADIDELFVEQRSRGVEIHGQGDFVVAMRRSAAPLSFPWRFQRAHPMEEIVGVEEPWGAVAHYVDAGGPPPDGRYADVTVEGRAVPLIAVLEGGAVVLVDTEGNKPRRWAEQFKRHGRIPNGTYDIHRTSSGASRSFADEPIDRRGVWTIDRKGNITAG